MRSYESVPNVGYRLACLLGFVAMLLRGGDKRLLGVAAAGTYLIYVVLTCLFYFVGLAYDNVPEVALLVLFLGGIEAVLHVTRSAVRRRFTAPDVGPGGGRGAMATA